jgi:PAS domain S-box-containing protein
MSTPLLNTARLRRTKLLMLALQLAVLVAGFGIRTRHGLAETGNKSDSMAQVGVEAAVRPALFLGNESLPPMIYMNRGKPTGIVVDLAKALAKRMHQPVEIRLMNWADAQQLVLDGRADALLQINPSPERLKIYDFSEPLLTSEFTIFTSAERSGVTSMRDLRGLKVGVEQGGLPIFLLQEDPKITVEDIPDLSQGFKMLGTGALDAVVADRWVGRYILAENNIEDIKLFDQPISRSDSAIAVKKGNANLLGDINAALADIRRDGTYDRIIRSWQSKEVVFKTREQLRQQAWLIAAITAALIVAMVGVAVLVREVLRRKRTEKALREREEQLVLFAEHAPAAIAMLDRAMRYVAVSRRWLADYGLEGQDLRGRSHYDVFPEIPARWKEIHCRCLAGAVEREEEDPFVRSDGSTQWLRWEIRPWHVAAGTVGGIVIFTEDITSRKQAEEALRLSAETFARTFHGNAAAMALTRIEDGTTLDVNDAWEELTGFSREEAIGKSALEHGIWRSQEDRAKMVRELKQHGFVRGLECLCVRKSGQEYTILMSAQAIRVRGEKVLLPSAIDITERKQAEQALRESEIKFRSAIANAAIGFSMATPDGRLVDANPAYCMVTGYDITELQATDFQGLIHPDDFEENKALVDRMLVGEISDFVVENRYVRKDGRVVWVRKSVSLVRSANGSPQWVISLIEDVSERKRAEESLKKAHGELERQVQDRTSELSEAVQRLRTENIQRRQLEDTLRQSENQVRFFASQCLTAQETERKRVAGELHDSIAASLSAMKFRIETLAEEMKRGNGDHEPLRALASMVGEITNDVRRIMADLRPSILDDLGITAALSWFCREYEKTYPHISVENLMGIAEDEVPDSLKTPIFRISQEAMNNIAKYSQASLVNLSLRREEDRVILTIQDNGQGFDQQTVKRGMGLSTMKERAQLSGGSFALESAMVRIPRQAGH